MYRCSVGIAIGKKTPKISAGDGEEKSVDVLKKKSLQSFWGLVEENRKIQLLVEKSSWPIPRRKNRKLSKISEKNQKIKLRGGDHEAEGSFLPIY